MNVFRRAWGAVKAFSMRWQRGASWGSLMQGSTSYDWNRAAGDGRGNAAVWACVRWVQRALPEAPLVVIERSGKDERHRPDHPLAVLLDRPNPYYSGLHLIGALVADLMLSGNAYILKVRSGAGRAVELWWIPSSMLEPRWPDDGSAYISHYDYTVDGRVTRIDPSDVVHVRQGFDPHNIRKGMSDLAALVREIATDNEAANWTASLLRNGAIPGVVISPDGEGMATQEEADEIKAKWMQRFGGDRRGEPLVMKGATKVTTLAFSPDDMNLSAIRAVPEERITAVLGIPAAVVGLGTGLEQTKVGATLAEMREQAYESCLIPMQRLIAAEFQSQLVPDFGGSTLRVEFDLSEVRVLQTDENALHQRARDDLAAGLLTLNQALKMVGQDDIGPAGEVRYLPTGVSVKPAADLLPSPVPEQLPAPTPLRALPEAAGRRKAETKAAEDIPALLDLLRGDDEPGWTAAMRSYLTSQLARVIERLATGAEDAVLLVPALESEMLAEILEPHQRATLEAVRRITVAELGVSFNLSDEAVREYLSEAGTNIGGITDTTREAVRAALSAGQVEGESIAQLTRRLRGLAAFSRSRAEMIARTELGNAQNLSTLANYRASGVVVGVRVHDGRDDDDACRAMDGRTFALDDALPAALEHPNCVRSFAPIVDADEIEGAA